MGRCAGGGGRGWLLKEAAEKRGLTGGRISSVVARVAAYHGDLLVAWSIFMVTGPKSCSVKRKRTRLNSRHTLN